MRAAVYRHGEIVVDAAPDPVPGPGQVLVRTLACGICGSDLHFQRHAHAFVDVAVRSGVSAMAVDLTRDIGLGHEFCAEVVDYGPGTKRILKPGRMVCSVPMVIGARGARTIGYCDEVPGGFSEYMLLSEALMLPVPEGLRASDAALTEPMAVGWHAAKLAALEPGQTPLIIGCGPVGLAVISALKRLGIGPIVAADYSQGRRDLAARMGAHLVVDPAKASPYDEWSATARQGPIAQTRCAIFECVGLPGMLRQIIEGAPDGADVIVVGACMEPDSFEPMMALHKALTLKFSRTYSMDEFAQVLSMIADGSLDVGPLVTESVGLEAVPRTFEALASPGAHAKVLVEPWR